MILAEIAMAFNATRGFGMVRWSGGLAAFTAMVLMFAGGCSSSPKAAPKSSNLVYAFWPQPPAAPRIQFVRAFAYSGDISLEKQSNLDKLVFGSESDRAVEINKPYGVDMHDGKIYVCDIRNVGLTILDLNKHQTRLVGTGGLNRLQNPVDVTVADDGTIYVADKLRGVVMYDSSEHYAGIFGHEKFQPVSLAVHGDRLYVCNMGSQNVEVMDRFTGLVVGTIGTVGDQDGQFRLPLGVAVDQDGNIHVVDVMRCRVQKFSPDGKLLAAVGEMTDTAGNFVRPKHIAVDREGQVYIVDAAFQNVQIFDRKYHLLTSFGGGGDFFGSMNLPAGICVTDSGMGLFQDEIHPYFDAKHLILVTNQFGANKVAVYALGDLKAGKTAQDLAASLAPMKLENTRPSQTNPLTGLDSQPLAESAPASQPAGESPR